MAFLNLFKKSKKELKREDKRQDKKPALTPVKKADKVKLPDDKKLDDKKKDSKKATEPRPAKKKGNAKIAPNILINPQITEKATLLQEQNDYIFKVHKLSTKPEIKKAVEEMYGVNVLGVRTINVPRKSKRLGRSQGWKQGYKKAIVRLSKDQSIEVIPR